MGKLAGFAMNALMGIKRDVKIGVSLGDLLRTYDQGLLVRVLSKAGKLEKNGPY